MKRIFVIAFIGAFGLSSCEKVIDLDVPKGEVQLVVDGWFNDLDTIQHLKLSSTAPYFEEAPTPRISGATVTLRTFIDEVESASVVLQEELDQPGFYRFPGLAEIGKGYQIEVAAPGFDPVRSDIQEVRETPPILNIFWEEEPPRPSDSLAIYSILISTFEFPGEGDFYRWFIYVDGDYQDSPSDILVTSDQLVDGAVLPEYEVSNKLYAYGNHIRIMQSRINQSAYEFLSLLRLQTAFSGTPFDTAPAPLKGNMKFIDKEGQALGFFGASSVKVAEIVAGQ